MHTPLQPIPDSVRADVMRLLQKFPSILRTGDATLGDAMPTRTHGVEHHIHKGSYPPVGLQNPAALIQKNLEIDKAEYKRMESTVLVSCSKYSCTFCF